MALTKLNFSGQPTLATSIFPTGSVIQTVTTGSIALTQITTTSTWSNTNYTLSITPQFSDSKILFQSANHFRLGGSTPIRGGVRVQRTVSSTDTIAWNSSNNTEHFQVRNADNEHDTIGSIIFLDSPATTSSVTYKVQGRPYNTASTGQVRINPIGTLGSPTSFITLMEVVA